MSTLVMRYQEQHLIHPIDQPTFIFALAAFVGVGLYGATAFGLIIQHAITTYM